MLENNEREQWSLTFAGVRRVALELVARKQRKKFGVLAPGFETWSNRRRDSPPFNPFYAPEANFPRPF